LDRIYLYPAYFRRVASGGYSVDFPDLPGCVFAIDSLEEALAMAREALSLHLYGMVEDGDAIPKPSEPAEARHVNFSQVLQEALKERLSP